jgi:hypothetical protein
MALRSQSLILYNFETSSYKFAIDFQTSFGGPILQASIPYKSYTLSELLIAIKNQMQSVDPYNIYTVSAVRSYSGGTQNRVTISTSGSYLSLLFGTGPRSGTSIASLIGFAASDQTGALSYTGTLTAGTALIPAQIAYSYLSPSMVRTNSGAVNISASGLKETIIWSVQQFFQCEFKYEPELSVLTTWTPLVDWLIQQKPIEFTPEISSPTVYYKATLEGTQMDSKGLGFTFTEMLPDFPFFYRTGVLKFRMRL